ncbi:hypothetical protein VHP8226_02600 [Vibrio hippocampi]|uniref:Uncharacterized protein n=1 Tax=Vibrio hippocampi TaxID=654686 RepID=A0ABN8DKI8_9VIBR|nr:hypothetical protein VHP8226_02600 [Vibrio hippocampi]
MIMVVKYINKKDMDFNDIDNRSDDRTIEYIDISKDIITADNLLFVRIAILFFFDLRDNALEPVKGI